MSALRKVLARLRWEHFQLWRRLSPPRQLLLWALRPRVKVYAHTNSVYQQPAFRGKGDTGLINATDWIAAENTNFSRGLDANFRVRFIVDDTVTSDAGGASNFKLQYDKNASATWNDVNATSLVARTFGSPNFVDGAVTTGQLTGPGGTFQGGTGDDIDGAATTAGAVVLQAGNYTELEFCIQLRSADLVGGDTVDLRVVLGDGTAFATAYTNPRITVDAFAPDVDHYRVYNDDGNEANSTPIAAEDAAATVPAQFGAESAIVQMRVLLQATNSVSGESADNWKIQVEKNDSASWADVTGASANVQVADSPNLLNNDLTTNRATNGLTDGTGSFITGKVSEDGVVNGYQLTGSNYTELLYTLKIIGNDVANADNLDFRLQLDGVNFTHSVNPRITVSQTNPTISSASMADGGRNFVAPFQDISITFSEAVDGAPGVDATIPGLTCQINGGANQALTYRSGDGTATWVVRTANLVKNGDTVVLDYDMATGVILAVDDNAELRATTDAAVTNNLTTRLHFTLKRGDTGAAITTNCSMLALDADPRDQDDANWGAVLAGGRYANVAPSGSGVVDVAAPTGLAVGAVVYVLIFNPREDATGTAEAYTKTGLAVTTVT